MPSEHLLEIPVASLKPGMFIAELDKPWLETPFALQGFFIQDDDDIDYVSKHCSYVYIDPGLMASNRNRSRSRELIDRASIRQELPQAKIDFVNASSSLEKVFANIRSNRHLDVKAVQEAINPLIDSVFRNREALSALVRMKDKGDYLFEHSLSCAIWSAVLGRHLGMDKTTLQHLALGAATMDVGMTLLPDALLGKKGKLTLKEVQQIHGHVKESLKILKESGDASNTVLNIVACHHERFDGSGYPRGMENPQIPLLARIAGLVDAYDAMVTQRPHAPARSSFDAMQELSDLRGIHFQESLVEQFVQAVGLFPTGTIVEINTGEVGVVVQQNSNRRLRPKVALILDKNKKRHLQIVTIDLNKYVQETDGTPTQWIAKEHEAGAFNLNPDEYFL